mgnify:CR=1 FL=1
MTRSEPSAISSYAVERSGKTNWTIRFFGRMDLSTSLRLLGKLRAELLPNPPIRLTVDLQHIGYFDDFGALVLIELKKMMAAGSGEFVLANTPRQVKAILSLTGFWSGNPSPPLGKKNPTNPFIHIGNAALNKIHQIRWGVTFIGSVALSFWHILIHPKSLRIGDMLTCMEKTGVNAVPIVALISFLLGSVMAFMSSLQLQQFGASVYVASLVAIAMVSELGPIMTAIIVAGRSGSAFAAEIGTMMISEEVDALVTMGLDPTLFLAIPRILAAVIVVPILTLLSNLFAIAGGLVVGVCLLDLTSSSYLDQTLEILTVFEITWGLAKSVVFAALISWIGCLRGFQTRGGADAVGNSATSAVVTGIFLIILVDSAFAIMRSYW